MSLLQLTRVFFKKFLKGPAIALALSCVLSCGGSKSIDPNEKVRAEFCKPVESSHEFDVTPYTGGEATILSFQNIRSRLISNCASCHVAPANTGGFTFIDTWQGGTLTLNGETKWYPGIFESAEKIRDALTNADPKKRMPPEEKRQNNDAVYLELGREINSWIIAGKPNSTFREGEVPTQRMGKERPQRPGRSSEIGECVPTQKSIGFDYKLDRQFEEMTKLPKFLTDTDLITLNALTLAQHGTFEYSVEYPLWADNAEKGRYVHVPMVLQEGELKKQKIELDSITQQFKIPENTRFYKTFYRAVTLPNKRTLMRRMETRIIVSRTPWQKSLFGSYQWDETEQVATLVETPYRDGTAWKDMVSDIVVDPLKNKIRPYAIPGRQRCIDCHMGSPMKNFILGFQPLQIHRRAFGEAGRLEPTAVHDLDQVERFVSYGLIAGVKNSKDLPALENMGATTPANVYELRANGYTVGNCYHCHNPLGLAFTPENGVKLGLGPGDIFKFNNQQKSTQLPLRRLVHQNGELDSSHIWRKISDSQAQLGMFSSMPMHTPGGPDCRALTLIGQWIRSFESNSAAEIWQPACKKENSFFWIDLDFTWVTSEKYVPRRDDWADVKNGMPQKYRDIELTPELKIAITTPYPVGYWSKKPECKFPEVNLPVDQQRPWMMRGNQPKRPFGEVYGTTPGSYFFRNTCMKCHGPAADGNSSLARGILNWSGGSVRVANFMDGMFGNKNVNLATFNGGEKNYAGQYMIWMAMEGTRVRFPPEISTYMGKHGAQMLNGIREKCLAQISSDKPSSPQFMDHEMFNKVCFMQNLEPGHADLKFDPATNLPLNPERVEEWLDRGAWNAGFAIFEFLKEASLGNWLPSNDQCEVLYNKEALK